ncbi:hypothetical protein C6341_g22385 [Phytophthora cactorum]|nr:hypothetical protein C6341_g22385 [Phytophthora cactorum]
MTARRSIPTSSTDKAVWGYSCAISHPWHPAQPSLVAFVETITENPQLTFVVTSAIIRCLLISNSAACMMHGFMYSKEDAVTVSGYDLTNYPIKATAITGVISATPVSNAYLMNALVREDLGFGGEVQTTLRSASSRTSVALHATRSKLYFSVRYAHVQLGELSAHQQRMWRLCCGHSHIDVACPSAVNIVVFVDVTNSTRSAKALPCSEKENAKGSGTALQLVAGKVILRSCGLVALSGSWRTLQSNSPNHYCMLLAEWGANPTLA